MNNDFFKQSIKTDYFFQDKEVAKFYNNKFGYFPLHDNHINDFELLEIDEIINDNDYSFVNIANSLEFSKDKLKEIQQYFYPEWNNGILDKLIKQVENDSIFHFTAKIINAEMANQLKDKNKALLTYTYFDDTYVLLLNKDVGTEFERINNWVVDRGSKPERIKGAIQSTFNCQPIIKPPYESLDDEDKFKESLLNAERKITEQIQFLKDNNAEFLLLQILKKYLPLQDILTINEKFEVKEKDIISPIIITEDNKLLLQEYNNVELKLPPIEKALYILFLKNENGIILKNISIYKSQLYSIYGILSNRIDINSNIESIDRLCNPLDNSINEKSSKINKKILQLMDKRIADHYCIVGNRGEPKYVSIAKYCKDKIIWNKRLDPWAGYSEEEKSSFFL